MRNPSSALIYRKILSYRVAARCSLRFPGGMEPEDLQKSDGGLQKRNFGQQGAFGMSGVGMIRAFDRS